MTVAELSLLLKLCPDQSARVIFTHMSLDTGDRVIAEATGIKPRRVREFGGRLTQFDDDDEERGIKVIQIVSEGR